MPDVFNKKKRAQVMAAIRSSGNKGTELKLVSIMRAHSIKGWRRKQRLLGKPDFLFRGQRLAVFVDGCFWHGCPKHGRKPGSNRGFWLAKLRRNKRRDKLVNRTLREMGWRILRFWAHDLKTCARVAVRLKQHLKCA